MHWKKPMNRKIGKKPMFFCVFLITMNRQNKIECELKSNGDLILSATIRGNIITRRYVYYEVNEAKEHFNNNLNRMKL